MDRVFLQWNFENWVTVILMAGLGFGLFAILAQVFKNLKAGGV